MSEFIFLIPRTPRKYKTSIRESLWEITKQSLINQTYSSWKALVVCDDLDEKSVDERIIYVRSEVQKKGEKINVAIDFITLNKIKVDYVIRLDDDDVIMPNALKESLKFDFDVYADRYHTFYDLSSGLLSAVKRKWLANTVIHKVSHAFKICDDTGLHVINHDHSLKWHTYYKNKIIIFTNKKSLLYVRILNPVSVSANEANNYSNYLSFFGKWNLSIPTVFEAYTKLLVKIQKENKLFIEHNNYGFLSKVKKKFFKRINPK